MESSAESPEVRVREQEVDLEQPWQHLCWAPSEGRGA